MKEKKRIIKLLHYFIVIFGCLVIVACGGGGGGGDDDDSGDNQAPTVPSNLTATAASSSRINLSWSASTDNVRVTAYRIFRDDDFLKAVTSTSASDTGLTPETTYCYRVSAVDAKNNESAQATQACATTSVFVPCGSLDVTDMQPIDDIEDLRPLISATISSPCGDDIDTDSIEMSLDGNPVTPTITGSGSEVSVSYTPADDLENTTSFTVEVSALDINGVRGEAEWDFVTGFFY